jgi:glycosyltransferase involved in cell wall biosynthesis
MKILLVTSFFPPTHTAGTEKRTLGYAKSLQGLGHTVQVFCAGEWNRGDQYWNGFTDEIYQQIPVRRLHLNWMLAPDPNRYLYNNPVVEKYMENWLGELKPDVVHITSCVSLSASVIQAVRNCGIPVVLTLTDFWFICPRVNLLRGDGSLCDGRTTAWDCLECTLWNTKVLRVLNSAFSPTAAAKTLTMVSRSPALNKQRGLRGMAFDMEDRKAYLTRMIRSADYVTAPSVLLSETVNACLDTKLVKVIHSGHDLTWLNGFSPVKRGNRIRIAYIGQIIPIKGVHLLLSAFLSADLEKNAELFVYGAQDKDPLYFEQLKEMNSGQKFPIHFKGSFSHEQLGEILSGIDVLVVPSLWHENNPRVIQEAFAAKIPVIATNVGGISEFVKHGVNGLLFERDSIEDLSKQLQRIVSDPELLTSLQAGMTPVRSLDDEIVEFEAIYKMLIADVSTPKIKV